MTTMRADPLPAGWGFMTAAAHAIALGAGRADSSQQHPAMTVDELADELRGQHDLLRVTTSVLARDLVEKFGVTRADAYRAITRARQPE